MGGGGMHMGGGGMHMGGGGMHMGGMMGGGFRGGMPAGGFRGGIPGVSRGMAGGMRPNYAVGGAMRSPAMGMRLRRWGCRARSASPAWRAASAELKWHDPESMALVWGWRELLRTRCSGSDQLRGPVRRNVRHGPGGDIEQ